MTTTAPSTPGSSAAAVDETLRSVLATGVRPARPGMVATSLTFGWRGMLKIKHVPEQLFDVTLFPVMFLLMFTYLFGGALAGSTGEYLQFVLPGILVMTVSMITIYTGTALNKDVTRGVFDRFRSLPIWRPSVLVGALMADAARYTMAAAVIIGLGMILGFRPQAGLTGVLLSVALLLVFAFSLSWIWTALGLLMRTPESLMAVSMTVLFPLTFLSNVFVEPETMPGWLEFLVGLNPITHLVAAVRGFMHGPVAMGEVLWVLVACAVLVVVFGPVTMFIYGRKQ